MQKRIKRWFLYFCLSLLTSGLFVVYVLYATFYQVNIDYTYALDSTDKQKRLLYVKSTDRFEDVLQQLEEKNILINKTTFVLLAKIKSLPLGLKAGKYHLRKQMNSNELINMLLYGLEEKINFSIENIHTLEEIAGKISHHIEADSAEIINWLNSAKLKKLGLNSEQAIAFFIPNKYHLSWATNANNFMLLAEKNFHDFWDDQRRKKSKRLNMNIGEITTLASIVQAEQTIVIDERPIIAGLYINRLKKNIRLQSDPTALFAAKDRSTKRVYKKHLETQSDYNTYKKTGLPPGPITLPSKHAIDAVLNYQQHDYLYMCAKDDFSGKHLFTNNFETHQKNAAKYKKALNLKMKTLTQNIEEH